MAVEQAAFVTCNSFRLLEVFNRHVKLKKHAKKKKKKEKRGGYRTGKRVRDRKGKGTEISRGCTKKSTDTRTQEKGNKTVSKQPDFCISIKISQYCCQIQNWLTKACK